MLVSFFITQDSQTRSTRATGDLLGIDIARIAVGKKVFKSKCALKLQPGTRRPYLLFVFLTELGEHEKIRVPLDGDGLKEFAYYLVNEEKEESEEYDDSMSIVAFCVTPSDSNGLKKFDKWYDGDDETSGMKYITMELRDKDEFQVSMKTIARLNRFGELQPNHSLHFASLCRPCLLSCKTIIT